jgi:hypothetical protein
MLFGHLSAGGAALHRCNRRTLTYKNLAFLNKFDHVALFRHKMRDNSFIILSSTASWTPLPHVAPDAEKTERRIC